MGYADREVKGMTRDKPASFFSLALVAVDEKTRRPEASASGLFVELQLILALDEAFLDHLLVAEPQIGDVG